MTMTKRLKPISLAPVPSLTRIEAEKVLKDFSRSGYREPIGPTPERLAKAGGAAKIEAFAEVVEVSRGDKFVAKPVDLARFRLDDSPFGRLKSKNILAQDPRMNAVLGRAGDMYFEVWKRAGTERIGAIDLLGSGGGGFNSAALFATEAQLQAWQDFNAAREKIPVDYRKPVDEIVLRERDAADVGREVSAYTCRNRAAAVAIHDLRRGLLALGYHFHLLSHSDGPLTAVPRQEGRAQ